MREKSDVFLQMTTAKIHKFAEDFVLHSRSQFLDKDGNLIHAGEFGTFREAICKEFLSFFLPARFGIGSGFVVNSLQQVSHQCDIVVYDAQVTPMIESIDKQRFFPIETVVAVGEVKSVLDRKVFHESLMRLSTLKQMRAHLNPQKDVRLFTGMPGVKEKEPTLTDQIVTFLICESFDFNLDISKDIPTNIPLKCRHNCVLSIKDGLLLYHNPKEKKHTAFPFLIDGEEFEEFESYFISNKSKGDNYLENVHHLLGFAHCFFLGVLSTSVFYPELKPYLFPN